MFFAMVAPLPYVRLVEFTLPDDYVEKSNLGMRRNRENVKSAREAVRFGDEYIFFKLTFFLDTPGLFQFLACGSFETFFFRQKARPRHRLKVRSGAFDHHR